MATRSICRPVRNAVTAKTNTPEPIPVTVTLTLPWDHAMTLRTVCRSIGGDPKGRRGHMDDISDALTEQGVAWAPGATQEKGSITFISQ